MQGLAVAPERSEETKLGGGGGQPLFVINGSPLKKKVCLLRVFRRHCMGVNKVLLKSIHDLTTIGYNLMLLLFK